MILHDFRKHLADELARLPTEPEQAFESYAVTTAALTAKSGADERVNDGEGTVSVRDDTPPPGPLATGIEVSPTPPEASAD